MINSETRDPPASLATPIKVGGLRRITVKFAGNLVTQPFGRLGSACSGFADVAIAHADYGQVVQSLAETPACDILIVHLDHRWFFEIAPGPEDVRRAEELVGLVRQRLAAGPGFVILNTIAWLPQSPIESERYRQALGLAAINRAILEFALEEPRVSVLDLAALLAESGHSNALREQNRHVMQFPYSVEATRRIVAAYETLIRARFVPRRKVVIVDADNTLWNGIIGEDGVDGIGIDEEFPNVMHLHLQRQLVQLRQAGFLLAAVTKNNEADFLEAFAQRAMPLSLDDLVTYRSNWREKSENIREIAEELNVGLDALVFIDDNPFEVEEVRSRIPEVDCHVFELDNAEAALSLIPRIASLAARDLTEEDRVKTEQYRAEAERKQVASTASSLEEYLASLDIRMEVSVNAEAHVSRVAQLTNKTNQFNLTTRRYSEDDIRRLMARERVYDFRVTDRFGDMGIVGVVIVCDAEIDTFLLSCRALGRNVESEMLRLVSEASEVPLVGRYVPSSRNQMTADFYDRHGFECLSERDGIRTYRQVFPIPPAEHVTIV